VSGQEFATLADRFKPDKFRADEYSIYALAVGMCYVVPTACHHDGFCLWDSKVSEFTTAKTGDWYFMQRSMYSDSTVHGPTICLRRGPKGCCR